MNNDARKANRTRACSGQSRLRSIFRRNICNSIYRKKTRNFAGKIWEFGIALCFTVRGILLGRRDGSIYAYVTTAKRAVVSIKITIMFLCLICSICSSLVANRDPGWLKKLEHGADDLLD